MKLQFTELEKDWDEGRLKTVHKKITHFLKKEQGSLAACLQVGQFYFHFHEFRSALQVIPLNEILDSNLVKKQNIETECLIFAARVLNALGASSYAFDLLEKIHSKELGSKNSDIAGIFTVNRRFREAISLYAPIVAHEVTPTTANSFVLLARCYTGIGNYPMALETITQYLQSINTKDPSSAASVYAVLGEIHIHANQLTKARKALEEALRLFGELPASNNVAYAMLWMGGCCALEGKHQQAKVLFNKAWKYFFRRGFHPESWLQIYYWQGLSDYLEFKRFPEPWLRLITYPGSWPGSLSEFSYRSLIEKWVELPSQTLVSIKGFPKKPLRRNLEIFSDSQDCRSLTNQLLLNLVLAGENGLPTFRAYELLWPKQLHAVSQLPKRFEQLCLRLRRDGIGLESLGGQHRCMDDKVSVHWMGRPTDPFQEFLNLQQFFRRSDVEHFFNVSKSKAVQMCQQWIRKGWVARENAGRTVTYKALPRVL